MSFVLPRGTVNGVEYYFFGKEAKGHDKGQLSAFGGKRDIVGPRGQRESYEHAAIREFHEESRGAIGSKGHITRIFQQGTRPYQQHGGTRMFIVDFGTREDPCARFRKGRGVKGEMSRIVRIRRTALQAAMTANATSITCTQADHKKKKTTYKKVTLPLRDFIKRLLLNANAAGQL